MPRHSSDKIPMMPISDTKPEVEAMQIEIRRRMSIAERFRVAVELSDLCHELAKTGIKTRHPEWSEREVALELLRMSFSPDPLPAWVR
jgi:hypothetical protein